MCDWFSWCYTAKNLRVAPQSMYRHCPVVPSAPLGSNHLSHSFLHAQGVNFLGTWLALITKTRRTIIQVNVIPNSRPRRVWSVFHQTGAHPTTHVAHTNCIRSNFDGRVTMGAFNEQGCCRNASKHGEPYRASSARTHWPLSICKYLHICI